MRGTASPGISSVTSMVSLSLKLGPIWICGIGDELATTFCSICPIIIYNTPTGGSCACASPEDIGYSVSGLVNSLILPVIDNIYCLKWPIVRLRARLEIWGNLNGKAILKT